MRRAWSMVEVKTNEGKGKHDSNEQPMRKEEKKQENAFIYCRKDY